MGGDGFNSHMPTLHRYRAMLEVWHPLQARHPLPKDDITHILEAGHVHG